MDLDQTTSRYFHHTDTDTNVVSGFPTVARLRVALFKGSKSQTTALTSELQIVSGLGVAETDAAQYQRIQRVRTKRATSFVERPLTIPHLIISAIMLGPVEGILSGPKRVYHCKYISLQIQVDIQVDSHGP